MKTLTLEEVFAPLSVTCRILGMIPLSTKNGRLEFSKPALLQTFAFLTTGTVLTAMFIVNFHKYVPYVPSKHNVMIKTAIMLRNSGSMVVTLLVVLSGYRNYFKLRDIKNTISTVDLKLVRMEGGECLAQDNYKKHKYLIKSLVFLNLVVVVGTEICTVLIRGHFSFVQILIVVYPQCIIRTLNATFYLFSSIIQTRFKMINRLFSTRFSKHQRNCFFENVTHIVSLHQVLVKLCAELNSIFSLLLLLWITWMFLLMIGDLHVAIYILLFNQFQKLANVFTIALKNCVIYVLDLCYLSRRCAALSYEVRSKITHLCRTRSSNVPDQSYQNPTNQQRTTC
jgi:hypothetical protein